MFRLKRNDLRRAGQWRMECLERLRRCSTDWDLYESRASIRRRGLRWRINSVLLLANQWRLERLECLRWRESDTDLYESSTSVRRSFLLRRINSDLHLTGYQQRISDGSGSPWRNLSVGHNG